MLTYEQPPVAPKTPDVLACAFECGYGHLRGIRAIVKQFCKLPLESSVPADTIPTIESFDLGSDQYNSPLKIWLKIQNKLLGFAYRHPNTYMKATEKTGLGQHGMTLLNAIGRLLDGGRFNKHLGNGLLIAGHSLASEIDNGQNTSFLLGLDPYAGLYYSGNDQAVTCMPDEESAHELKVLKRQKNVTFTDSNMVPKNSNIVVTGPIVAPEISEARKNYKTRLRELEYGKGLRIAIATGGSLTHGDEIVGLARAYANAMNNGNFDTVEKVSVIIGNSDSKEKGGDMKGRLEGLFKTLPAEIVEKFEIIYDNNPEALVEKADMAFGKSDVIHAKTGELVYTVAGCKAFETFGTNPSLGPQEMALRNYVERTARNQNNLCALEQGEVNYEAEVEKIIDQFDSGILLQRMQAGLLVPDNGAEYVATMALKALEKKQGRRLLKMETPTIDIGREQLPLAAD